MAAHRRIRSAYEQQVGGIRCLLSCTVLGTCGTIHTTQRIY